MTRRNALGTAALASIAALLPRDLAAAPSPHAPRRLPREQLLLYRTSSGRLRPVQRPSQWARRRAEIVKGFLSITGPLPGPEKRVPLDLRLEDEVDQGDFLRRLISYQSEPGPRVPAYLLVPKSALSGRPAPAALCLHQTHAAGQKVVVGLGQSPDDEYGVELARRGYVCLAPPYPLLAEYQPDVLALGYASGTMKAVWDNMRGLDLLDSLPFVRRGPVAAIGHSLGGHNAIFTAVMDPRLQVVVTSCAFDSFLDYMNGDLTGWSQTRYLPRLRDYRGRFEEVPFDFHELLGALAPRAFFANAPLHDSNFHWDSVDRVAAAARQVYRLHHAEDRLVVRHPDSQHRFPPEVRQEAYAFIDRHLSSHHD
ncbi:MAG: alpha/beta hydrolase [Verrucomicrobiales bacterium]|nr:alpha/beta hydrolase [Verrucomicrobiales bacterium]